MRSRKKQVIAEITLNVLDSVINNSNMAPEEKITAIKAVLIMMSGIERSRITLKYLKGGQNGTKLL